MLPTRVKKWTLGVVLGAILIWPAIHRRLVAEYHINSWRHGGFAMYCQAHRVQDFAILQIQRGRVRPINPERLSEQTRMQAGRYQRWWRQFGDLADPRALAEQILEEIPEAEGIRLQRRRGWLDPSTARIEYEVESWRVERE